MKVIWTPTALRQLKAIRAYIASQSPFYAEKVIDRIMKKGEYLGQFPLMGRQVPEATFKQLREVIEGPYRIFYHLKSDQIDIISVLHGAQLTPWAAPSNN